MIRANESECFGYRQPPFISHLLTGLQPNMFLEVGVSCRKADKKSMEIFPRFFLFS